MEVEWIGAPFYFEPVPSSTFPHFPSVSVESYLYSAGPTKVDSELLW